MRIIVDEGCSGHGRCASVAPDVFVLDDDGYNRMDEFEVAAGLEHRAQAGADSCPERVIRVLR